MSQVSSSRSSQPIWLQSSFWLWQSLLCGCKSREAPSSLMCEGCCFDGGDLLRPEHEKTCSIGFDYDEPFEDPHPETYRDGCNQFRMNERKTGGAPLFFHNQSCRAKYNWREVVRVYCLTYARFHLMHYKLCLRKNEFKIFAEQRLFWMSQERYSTLFQIVRTVYLLKRNNDAMRFMYDNRIDYFLPLLLKNMFM